MPAKANTARRTHLGAAMALRRRAALRNAGVKRLR
jgi:hypothetical protein